MNIAKVAKVLSLIAFLSIGTSFAVVDGSGTPAGPSCSLESRSELLMGVGSLRTSVWSCSDGCTYTTTSVSILVDDARLIISDVSSCDVA